MSPKIVSLNYFITKKWASLTRKGPSKTQLAPTKDIKPEGNSLILTSHLATMK
jgi:hypothetical protein